MIMGASEVRDAIVARVEARLKAVNGRRRERLLTASRVLGLLDDVIGGEDWAWTDGGTVKSAYSKKGFRGATTTIALVARVGAHVGIGIDAADALSTTPGRAWPRLQPWRYETGPTGKPDEVAAKWAAWAAGGGIIRLSGPQVDALVECRESAKVEAATA
jgi:hypothetical protein